MVEDSDAEREEERDVRDVKSYHDEGRWFGDRAAQVEEDVGVDEEQVSQIRRAVEGGECFHVCKKKRSVTITEQFLFSRSTDFSVLPYLNPVLS